MRNGKTKFLDLELFIFYFVVSFVSFVIYIVRHPFLYVINKKWINSMALFSAYAIDIIVFFSVFLPYLFILAFLLVTKVLKREKVSDNVITVLFFPLLSLFIKGMSMLHVYTEISIKEIFLNNYIFFAFNLLGPILVFGHKTVVYLKKIKAR